MRWAGRLGLLAFVACSSSEATVPNVAAPPSRHVALAEELRAEQAGYSFRDGVWLEGGESASFYGISWLSRATALTGDEAARREEAVERANVLLSADLAQGALEEKLFAGLGLLDHEPIDFAAIDALLDRVHAYTASRGDYVDGGPSASPKAYGPTVMTALAALLDARYALTGGPRAAERQAKAIAYDRRIADVAFRDLAGGPSGQVRAFASGPESPSVELVPNALMLLVEGSLFRLTREDAFRLQARSLYVALEALKITDVPARFASPGSAAAASFGATTDDVSTLADQNYAALALMEMFAITGERRFVDEADRVLDGLALLHGSWCLSQVHVGACVCAAQVCVKDACVAERCQLGLLDHLADGRLARAGDARLFDASDNLHTLYVLGIRHSLAREPF